MFDHLGFPVSNLQRAVDFYTKALEPLDVKMLFEVTPEMSGDAGSHFGFGVERPQFWISSGKKPQSSLHVAFNAKDRKTVDTFYAAAIAAGGKDNGAPGLRPHYHEHYYGAFVLDHDGNNIEAVCHSLA